jgi:hypothetical protein
MHLYHVHGVQHVAVVRPADYARFLFRALARINAARAGLRSSYGASDPAYAASAIMSSRVSFSTDAFMRALPIPARAPCLKS